MDGARARPFRLGALIALGGGAAALAHELLWTRRLVDLLGASSEATARVLGCFFLGLALGGVFSTRLVRRARRPWRTMGLLEAGIAVLTLPALFLPRWTDWIWPSLGPERLIGWEGDLIKAGVSLAVVFPPAFFMGTTLPVLAVAVLGREGELGREGVWL
jgi:spermidine synthase